MKGLAVKAMAYDRYGDESVLVERELPPPEAGPGQVLVHVTATSVSPADWRLRSGQFRRLLRLRFPFVPGSDLSGTVLALGAGVDDLSVGDRVVACTPTRDGGGSADLAVVERAHVARAPRTLGLVEAAALPLCGLTVLQALDAMGELRGRTLLVVGASGGVGTLAVQVAASRGAHVTAYARRDAGDLLMSLGAERVVAREDVGLDDASLLATFDRVLDAANAQPLRRSSRLLAPGGCAVTVNPFSGRLHPDALAPLRGGRVLRSVLVRPDGSRLDALCRLVDEGEVRPVVQRVLPLGELAEAHRAIAAGGVLGKTVVEVAPDR